MNGLALPASGGDHACPKWRALFGLSLCAGAGGLDLGLHLAMPGYRTVCYVERESYAAATLVARMEDKALDRAPVWDDVANFDGKAWRGMVDIVHGGYPCQPFSVAGRKLGDKDPRHLWPHIARIVREVKPPVCFFENVGGHLRLGFEQVHDDLRAMGYRVKAGLFTAAEVGAPHKRERLFILAYAEGSGERRKAEHVPQTERRQDGSLLRISDGAIGVMANASGARAGQHKFGSRDQSDRSQQILAHAARLHWQAFERFEPKRDDAPVGDADGAGLERRRSRRQQSEDAEQPFPPGPEDEAGWQRYLERAPHLEPAVCRGADGLANRVDRLRLCGNGVVPLVAAYAFCALSTQAIKEHGSA